MLGGVLVVGCVWIVCTALQTVALLHCCSVAMFVCVCCQVVSIHDIFSISIPLSVHLPVHLSVHLSVNLFILVRTWTSVPPCDFHFKQNCFHLVPSHVNPIILSSSQFLHLPFLPYPNLHLLRFPLPFSPLPPPFLSSFSIFFFSLLHSRPFLPFSFRPFLTFSSCPSRPSLPVLPFSSRRRQVHPYQAVVLLRRVGQSLGPGAHTQHTMPCHAMLCHGIL